MSRVFLIKCSKHAGFLSGFTFPLGLMYMASTLRQSSDKHEIAIHDLRIRDQDYSDLKENLSKFKPDVVGLSAITMEEKSMQLAAQAVRDTGFEGPMVAGGPHPTSFPEYTLASEGIDYVVIGEGEETFKELVQALSQGKDPKKVPGIAYRENGHVEFSATRPAIEDLDGIPMPAWDLVEMDKYFKYQSMSGMRSCRYMNLFTSRACPFHCTYCHSIFGKRFRARSPESVLEEVKLLVDGYNINYLEIVDDIFNCDMKRAKKILDLLYQEGLPVELTFPNGLRCDTLDREFLEKLSRFKFSQICVPVETVSPRLQKMIKKNLNIKKVSETIDICADLRVYTRGFFMIGFPTETEEEMRATVDFAVKSKLHAAIFFIVVPFRGTELYDQCKRLGRGRYANFEDYDYNRSPVNLSDAPDKVLFGLQKWVYVRQLMYPSRIYRILRDFPDRRFFWTGFKVWSELFKGAGRGRRYGKPDLVPGASRFWWWRFFS